MAIRSLKYIVCAVFITSIGLVIVSNRYAGVSAQEKVDFKRDIQPIFSASCYNCHGGKKAMGQLRLDNKAAAMKGGLSGRIIVPGKSQESLLIKRISGEELGAQMPMAGDPLTKDQIELVSKWIEQGAVWPDGEAEEGGKTKTSSSSASSVSGDIPKHWAYIKPSPPTIPYYLGGGSGGGSQGAGKGSNLPAFVRNPIDAFILARLDKEELKPSPEADKATLLRRVYLDVIGLPPSIKDVDDFLADKSPNAYEKVVNKLLAMPQYGERWARPWLDLARYADSNGYEKDNLRVMWKYKDWIINALNVDMSFDQFTIEQIAGDMLPNPTESQLIATGFHRNTMVNQEGGIDPDESRFEVLIDRVSTTGTVWLGTTVGCAQCHNHKYDPISQKDFYKMMAFFEGAEYKIGYQYPGVEESRYLEEPEISLPTPQQSEKKKTLDAEIKALEVKLNTMTPELKAEQVIWEQELINESSKWKTLEYKKIESTGKSFMKKLDDGSILVSGPKLENDVYVIEGATDLKKITGIRIEAIPDSSLPKGGPGRDPYGNFLLTGVEVQAYWPSEKNAQEIVFKKSVETDDQAYSVDPWSLFGKQVKNTAIDRPPGWFVNATGDTMRVARQAVIVPEKSIEFLTSSTSHIYLQIKLKYQGGALNQGIGRFRVSVTESSEPDRIVSISAKLRPALTIAPDKRDKKQSEDLEKYFLRNSKTLKPDRDRLAQLKKDVKALGIMTAMVMKERPSYDRPYSYFHDRGSFLNKGPKVFAATPAQFHSMPEDASLNRLGLAKWLVSDDNPLTARVTVNRFWENIFGRGLVETSEDFGTQGEHPSHPELLDWLAIEFMKPKSQGGHGWSMKELVRLLVTSSTYRQSSYATKQLIEKDQYNRLLARGPRFRMEAEMVRDTMLEASGLLSHKTGGPSVFPLQPDGLWRIPYSGDKWERSSGEDRYRRTLYTFYRRSNPHPMLTTFDATTREFCTVRRVRTNTPLQALTMLNNEEAMEAARALSKMMIDNGGGDLKNSIIYGFRSCTARIPNESEINRLVKLFDEQKTINAEHAWTMMANVLLNLDETVTKN